jgi:hypothetical protein
MRARRGFLLAGIHLGLALPLLVWNAGVRLATGEVSQAWPDAVVHATMLQEADQSGEVAKSMGPCARRFVGERLSADERLISAANLPASIVAGWFDSCPARWTISAVVDPAHEYSRGIAAELIAVYAALIGLQWFLVGGFPLVQTVRWWREPGAIITTCFAAGALPMLAFDAAGALRGAGAGAYAPTVSSSAAAIFADSMSVMMVLSWSGWALLILARVLQRARSMLQRHSIPSA